MFASIALAIKIFITMLINVISPDWFVWIQIGVMSVATAWQAYTICNARNILIRSGVRSKKFVNAPSLAIAFTLSFLMLLLLLHYGVSALYYAVFLINEGMILNGLLIIFIGLPVFFFIMRRIFNRVVIPIQESIEKRLERKWEEAQS